MPWISRLAPPVVLMAVIWWLSDQPNLSSGLGTWDLILRKIAHMTIFGALWFLAWRAQGYRRPLAAAIFTFAYAVSDELHQTTVEGRHGSPLDVAIDTVGIAVAWTLSARAPRLMSRASRARWP